LHEIAPDLFPDDAPVVTTVEAALHELGQRSPELVLVDVRSVGADGLRLLARADPELPPTLVLGATEDEDTIQRAVELGASGWLVAPFASSELRLAVASARHNADVFREHEQEISDLRGIARLQESALRTSTDILRAALDERTESQAEAVRTQAETIRRLARAIESRANASESHVDRVGRYCALISERIGYADTAHTIELAAALHDVGTLTVPDIILLKRSPLTEDERALMELHCRAGHAILTGAGGEVLELAATIALTHHESFDGSGYPDRLAGEAIPLAGRIVAIADGFDTLMSEWPFREALNFDAAARLLAQERAGRFDPNLLDVFLAAPELPRIYAGA
jgi:response regulator RpfG family c-di-GMP phosphodiesterase